MPPTVAKYSNFFATFLTRRGNDATRRRARARVTARVNASTVEAK
jgi:hypothetical protein